MWQKFIAGTCVMTGAVGFGLALCGVPRDICHTDGSSAVRMSIFHMKALTTLIINRLLLK